MYKYKYNTNKASLGTINTLTFIFRKKDHLQPMASFRYLFLVMSRILWK